MQAYLFGSHRHSFDRDLILKHITAWEPGQGLRAHASIVIGDFDGVIAVEFQTLDDLRAHTESLQATGFTPETGLVACLSPDCLGQLVPSVAPMQVPWYACMVFVLLSLDRPLKRMIDFGSAEQALAVEAGGRRALIELGADTLETLQADVSRLGALPEVKAISANYFRGHELSRRDLLQDKDRPS